MDLWPRRKILMLSFRRQLLGPNGSLPGRNDKMLSFLAQCFRKTPEGHPS